MTPVLIVDDKKTNLHEVAALLREKGHTVKWVNNTSASGLEQDEAWLKLQQENLELKQTLQQHCETEVALRANEASLAAAQRIGHFGSWEQDLKDLEDRAANPMRWSDEMFRLAGYEPGSIEVTNELFFRLVHPDDHEAIREAVAEALREKKPYSVVHRLIRPDGEERIVQEIAHLLFDESTGAPLKMIGTTHDITDKHRSQVAFEKSEQELRLLAKELDKERLRLVTAQAVAKVGSWETNLQTFEVQWSAEAHRIHETDEATFHPTHEAFLQIVHPDDREAVNAAFLNSLHLETPCELKHRLRMPDGRIKYIQERWQVFQDENEQPQRALGTCRDITEQVETETKMQLTTDLLRAVAEGTPDAVFVKDLEGRYLLFNEGACKLVGRSVEEVLGQDDLFLFGPEGARVVRDSDRQVMSTNQVLITEEILTAAGVTRTYSATKAPYRDNQGNVIGLIGISRDVTDSKAAEIKLREQATLLDKAQDAILMRSLEHHILYWNHSAERLYGWTKEEALGKSIQEMLYKDPSAFQEATAATIKKGEWHGELQQTNKDGQDIIVEARWTLVRSESGEPKAILAINTDITERKKLEQQFLRAQRMESIGTLAGGIAHDLNNVLAPIMMAIELLKLHESDSNRLNILSTIEGSAKRGADMVSQVLSFARGVESQQLDVRIGHLIQEVEKIANETFFKSIQVKTHVPDDLWIVQGDPTQLHQVLVNLCVNARDAMPDGGTLTLSAHNEVLEKTSAGMNLQAEPGPYIVLKVMDTGTGMTTKTIERIFEPFYTTKELGKGTGLGLSTTLAIIKSHGGFIRVHSELGIGSQFHVYLPAQTDPPPELSEAQPVDLPRGQGELILVVDDEDAVRQITRQTLEAFGYRVLLANDGAEATAYYAMQKDAISAILTDMMMPVMDGPTTIPVLLRINPHAQIIAASGLNVSDMVANAMNAGVKHFIPKPYTAETLLTKLRQVLTESPS
ncbi:PAS domain S-box protein [Prosthecobacter dejongeii]|uniref:histidine kinase n=1 Tax=Prosthecobacter dejongeii TaxID=48465 RepID=A0A7W8DR04_9BACT|nr:PAS domain S-box protein [Prosthecobacter dejongeii]MBB5039319.1 PAS domain S-box-containing protein [Prosthecobacter dejongeii]